MGRGHPGHLGHLEDQDRHQEGREVQVEPVAQEDRVLPGERLLHLEELRTLAQEVRTVPQQGQPQGPRIHLHLPLPIQPQ